MTIKSFAMYNPSRTKNITLNRIDKINCGIDTEKPDIKRLINKTSNIYEGKLINATQVILTNTRKNLSPKSNPTIICKTLSNDTFTVNNRKKFKKSILTLPNKLEKSIPMCDKTNKCEPNNEKVKKTNKFNKRIEISSNQSSTNCHKTTKKPSKNNSGKSLSTKGNNLGDVWTILNNIDTFKVVPTPAISQASLNFSKKKNNLSKRGKFEVKRPAHKVDNEIKVIYSPDSSVSSSITAVIASNKYRRKSLGQENKFCRKINKTFKIEDGIKQLKNIGKGQYSTSFKENPNKIKNRVQPTAKSTSEVVSNKLKTLNHPPVVITQKPANMKPLNMTVAEIKSKIAQLKFPIVILGKDELSSTVHVEKYESPQFRGLKKQIWPFMKDWSIETRKVSPENMETPNRRNAIANVNSKNAYKNYDNSLRQLDKNKLRQNTSNVTQRKEQIKPLIKKSLSQKVQEINKKEECFKDLNKTAVISADDTNLAMDIGEEMVINSKKQRNDDLIDSIILKLEQGIYYNMKPLKREPRRQLTDKRNSSKTANLKNEQLTRKYKTIQASCTNFNKDLLLSIPGFEKCLSDIQIEEICPDKVIVTHSRTKFSLELITDESWSENSDSCIPLKLRPNVYTFPLHINIESLPENLCSIMPNLIQNIRDSTSNETLDKPRSSAEAMKLKHKISKLQSQFSLSWREE